MIIKNIDYIDFVEGDYKYKTIRKLIFNIKNFGYFPEIFTEYITVTKNQIIIKKGYAWDGASGPTIDTDTSMRGSLFHDALYQLLRLGLLLQSFRLIADKIFRYIILADGMYWFRAWVWYKSVRCFAGGYARKE